MANVKVSGLTPAASVASDNQFEINESGSSKRVTAQQIADFALNQVPEVPVATQQEAEAGTVNDKFSTPLRTAQQTTARLATEAEAEAGTDNTKLMTPLRTAQAIEEFSPDPLASKPIAEPFGIWDHITGAPAPDNSGTAKFIRLTAGQSGVGEYNEGLLTDEQVSGSAPLVEATAEIMVGPMAGQRVPLINTEGSFIRPGADSGQLQFDQTQRITGRYQGNRLTRGGDGAITSGVFSSSAFAEDAPNGINSSNASSAKPADIVFDTADSPNARTSETTDGETRSKNRQATFYMRIA